DNTRVGLVIDGGSSLFAIDRFISDLVFSMISTVLDADAFDEFYKRYTDRVTARRAFVAAAPGEEDQEKGLLSDERDTTEFKDFSSGLLAHLRTDKPKLFQDVDRYESHVEQRLKTANKIPKQKSKEWHTSLTDGTYPSADELNTKFEAWIYLIKRIMH